MNRFKKERALAGLPVASITSYSLDMIEQFKQTTKYKKKKEEKKKQRKSIIRKMKKSGNVDYQKAYDMVYSKPSTEVKSKYKPRLRTR